MFWSPHRVLLVRISILGICLLAGTWVFLGSLSNTLATHDVPPTFHDPVELEGYMWSDNIGWVSMNCLTAGVGGANKCGTAPNNKVYINPDYTITGYGWSDNIGWIQFGVGGCPTGTCAARINNSTQQLEGWARALSNGGGWDGWISLNCTNNSGCGTGNYGVDLQTGGFTACNASQSCAWGSDLVGWLDWSSVSFTPPCMSGGYQCTADSTGVLTHDQFCADTGVVNCTGTQLCSESSFSCVTPVVPVVNDFSLTPTVVRQGETVTVSWNVDDAISCRVANSAGPDMTDTENPVGSYNVSRSSPSAPLDNPAEFTLFCVAKDLTPEQELGTIEAKVIPFNTEI